MTTSARADVLASSMRRPMSTARPTCVNVVRQHLEDGVDELGVGLNALLATVGGLLVDGEWSEGASSSDELISLGAKQLHGGGSCPLRICFDVLLDRERLVQDGCFLIRHVCLRSCAGTAAHVFLGPLGQEDGDGVGRGASTAGSELTLAAKGARLARNDGMDI